MPDSGALPPVATPYDGAPRHPAPYECETCGGPEWTATSNRGCDNCGSQDEILPRGTLLERRRRGWLISHGYPVDSPRPVSI